MSSKKARRCISVTTKEDFENIRFYPNLYKETRGVTRTFYHCKFTLTTLTQLKELLTIRGVRKLSTSNSYKIPLILVHGKNPTYFKFIPCNFIKLSYHYALP